MKLILGVSLVFLFISCKQIDIPVNAKKVYDNRIELLQEFKNISLFRRGDSSFLLYIYNNSKANRYLFRNDDGFKLQSDTIQFPLSALNQFKHANTDTIKQEEEIKDLLKRLVNKMDTLDIREVSSDRTLLGINTEFFLRTDGVVFFVENISAVTNPIWQKYIAESKEIGDSWYYKEN